MKTVVFYKTVATLAASRAYAGYTKRPPKWLKIVRRAGKKNLDKRKNFV